MVQLYHTKREPVILTHASFSATYWPHSCTMDGLKKFVSTYDAQVSGKTIAFSLLSSTCKGY